MNSDVSKELLRKINKSFTLSYQKSEKVRKLLLAIKSKNCDYLKAMEYAEEVGKILAEAYMKNLSSDVLPDGKMYYDIASAILNPTLENNYGLISSYVCGAMDVMNEKAGINVKARKPSYNVSKTLGLIKKVSEAEYFDDVKNYLNEPVITNALSIVDEGVRVNADLHYSMGYKPVIVRRASFGCCKWCRSLAGTKEYYPAMDRDIFRRHQNCRCVVVYDPRNSDEKVQDVWSKKWNEQSKYDVVSQRLASNTSNKVDSIWPKAGTKITKAEYKKFRDKALDLGFKISGFKDFEGDQELVISCLKKAQPIREKYPELFEGSIQVILSQTKTSTLMGDDTFAITYHGHEITLNGNAFISKDILKTQYQEQANERWFVKGTDYYSIIIHELGHVISSRYNINGLEVAKKITGLSENDTLSYLKDNLSVYSGSLRNGNEIIAEVFSDYFNNKNTSDFSLKFIEEIDKIILKEGSEKK